MERNRLHLVSENITDVFIDMDGVIAYFTGSPHFKPFDKNMRKPPRMFEEGFFENLPVLPGARWGVRVLLKNPNLNVCILTQPVSTSAICYSEKVSWIAKIFPELLERIMIVHDKGFVSAPGRILIDDMDDRWKQKWESHGGRFIHFNPDNAEQCWIDICKELNPDYFNKE